MLKKHKEILGIIQEAEKYGIVRDPNNYSFIVVYPPSLTLERVSQKTTQKILHTLGGDITEDLNLYDHNPYCTGKCKGCSFLTESNPKSDSIKEAQEAKKRELEIYRAYTAIDQREIISIYFGGGTPTFLPASQLGAQLGYYTKRLHLSDDCEITVESSPETMNRNKAKTLLSYGFNRLSIGFQSLDNIVLLALERRHNAEMALTSFEIAREAGFKKINIDLMYGVMEQTIDGWLKTVEGVLKLRPEYITIYNYRREGKVKKEKYNFSTKEESFMMYLEAQEKIISASYIQIAPNQFALPGIKFIYQQEKWHYGKQFLGLGPGAYSYFNGWVYHNLRDRKKYLNAISRSEPPIWIGKEILADFETELPEFLEDARLYLHLEELVRRTLIFGLKTSGINNPYSGVDFKLLHSRFQISTLLIVKDLKRLINLGLVYREGNYLRLTLAGLVVSEEVCRELYSDEVKQKLDKVGDKFGRGGF